MNDLPTSTPDTLPYTPAPAQRMQLPLDPRTKSPALAAFLSSMPGLGQVYLGYIRQGFLNIVVIAGTITALATGVGAMTPLLALFLAFYWLYNMVDAYRRAELLNLHLAGLTQGQLPEDLQPSLHGSVFLGLTLIATGLLLFAHIRFGLPLAWIERWWPLALVGLGTYLLAKAIHGRLKTQDAPAA